MLPRYLVPLVGDGQTVDVVNKSVAPYHAIRLRPVAQLLHAAHAAGLVDVRVAGVPKADMVAIAKNFLIVLFPVILFTATPQSVGVIHGGRSSFR